jgi:hypothetical protein
MTIQQFVEEELPTLPEYLEFVLLNLEIHTCNIFHLRETDSCHMNKTSLKMPKG